MKDQITARYVRVCPSTTTGLPTPAELWETSAPVDVGWLSFIRTRHLLLVREEYPGAEPAVQYSFVAATPAGLVDLSRWKPLHSSRYETRAGLLEDMNCTVIDGSHETPGPAVARAGDTGDQADSERPTA